MEREKRRKRDDEQAGVRRNGRERWDGNLDVFGS